jgi:hypothetical protein
MKNFTIISTQNSNTCYSIMKNITDLLKMPPYNVNAHVSWLTIGLLKLNNFYEKCAGIFFAGIEA